MGERLVRWLRRREQPSGTLVVDWNGSSAVISHPDDSPLVLWQLLRDAAAPGDDVLIMMSGRAVRDTYGGSAIRGTVERAARSWRTRRVWIAADGVGRPRGAHAAWLHRLAERTAVELLVPDGSVRATTDGTLYVAPDAGAAGWRSFRTGGTATVAALRHPVPFWERMVPRAPVSLAGLLGDPVPAGLLLRLPHRAPAGDDDAYRLPVDPRGPAVVIQDIGVPPVHPSQVADLFGGLPPGTVVHLETRLLDRRFAGPEAAWVEALDVALVARQARSIPVDPYARLSVERRLRGDGPSLVDQGWVRAGKRRYQHVSETALVADVKPAGIMLRLRDAGKPEDRAFVHPDKGVLMLESAASAGLAESLRRVLAGLAGRAGVVVAGGHDGARRLVEVLAGGYSPPSSTTSDATVVLSAPPSDPAPARPSDEDSSTAVVRSPEPGAPEAGAGWQIKWAADGTPWASPTGGAGERG
ncbi:hypothetical protein AB0M54_40265 [Actinoplanes sp. NPDC051470]|uniref:hypothetical protein n=1 Tax=Actinoplanes sp. NPDC051470 TaxID=3157224 RepID=UPI00341C9EE5